MVTTDTSYLAALRGEVLDTPPVWMMRQAGRYLPEYLAIRDKYSFLEVCHTPELACEVTLQPIRRFHFDASILFSDILVPLVPMGAELTFGKGHGPIMANPLRKRRDVDNIKPIDPVVELSYVHDAVRMIRSELPDDVTLIGFAGVPFTLSCYWIEGGKPEPFANIKAMMYREPEMFNDIQEKLSEMVVAHLIAMRDNGADAVQLFDTWAGILSPSEYQTYVLPILKKIFARLHKENIPTTYFARSSHHLLREMKELDSTAISLDWRTPIQDAGEFYKGTKSLQGNLDPTVLLGDEAIIRRETRIILDAMKGYPGHIFNLGHGILPMTPIQSVEIMLDEIRGDK